MRSRAPRKMNSAGNVGNRKSTITLDQHSLALREATHGADMSDAINAEAQHEQTDAGEGLSVDVEDDDEVVAPQAAATPIPVVQGYRSSFNQTVAPPNAPLSRVIRPAVDFPPDSKRAQLIEDAEVDLEQDMDELKSAVHAYNVDFQRRIDEVKARGRVLETQIRSEYEAMEESMNQLEQAFKASFQTTFLSLEQKTLAHFARVEATAATEEERKLRECEADAREFFYTTVPEIMENLQGTITRKLEKNHETFDIENAKTQKRERKTISMMENNEKRTETNFQIERERRHIKFREREEDFHHVMRVDNRGSERQQSNQVDVLVSLQTQLAEEQRVREKEDLKILDSLSSSFHRLQSSILENLGETS